MENAQRVALNHAIPEVYSTWQELVTSDSVDIVSIVSPPHLHCEMAVAALRAGKHVICEKPTALNVAEAEAMFAAAQAAPQQMAIIDHELRFHPLRMHMRQLLRDGYVGTLLHIELDWLFAHRLDANVAWSWHSDAERGGGVLGAVGSHLFDLARWLGGRVEALAAQLRTGPLRRQEPGTGAERPVTADDHAHLMLRYNSGAQASIFASALHPENLGMSITAVGSEGAIRIDYQDRLWGMRTPNFPRGEWAPLQPPQPMVDVAKLPSGNPFAIGSYYLAQAMAASLAAGQTALPDAASFYDGLVVQRTLDAAKRSHAELIWVRF
jgi:predicted dehydrogenase